MRQYVYDGCVSWMIGEKGWRIRKLSTDTNTTIVYRSEKDVGYFEIGGTIENAHRARIVLQKLEEHFVFNQHNRQKPSDDDNSSKTSPISK